MTASFKHRQRNRNQPSPLKKGENEQDTNTLRVVQHGWPCVCFLVRIQTWRWDTTGGTSARTLSPLNPCQAYTEVKGQDRMASFSHVNLSVEFKCGGQKEKLYVFYTPNAQSLTSIFTLRKTPRHEENRRHAFQEIGVSITYKYICI